MLKFFRRIRQQLFHQGNIRKYALYAIGEIALVMIGILLALQVNNWNEKRLEKIEEQAALLNLQKDFDLNRKNLLNSINQIKNNIQGSATILNHTGQKYQPPIQLDIDSLLLFATSTPRYFPQNGFLNELINSGKLFFNNNFKSLKILFCFNL